VNDLLKKLPEKYITLLADTRLYEDDNGIYFLNKHEQKIYIIGDKKKISSYETIKEILTPRKTETKEERKYRIDFEEKFSKALLNDNIALAEKLMLDRGLEI
jgi:GH15 family glucan-1,4-alpha-glucosidase